MDERKRYRTGHRGVVYRERSDGTRNYAYYNTKYGRYLGGYESLEEAMLEQKRARGERKASEKALRDVRTFALKSRNPRDPGNGGVYFVQGVDGGPVKIGWTRGNPHDRVRHLQTGSPVTLRLVGWLPRADKEIETELHQRLSFWRLHGEWFEPARELYELLRAFETTFSLPTTYPFGEEAA